MESSKVCSGGDTLIFACSGAADVGAVADRAAREMTKRGIGQMFCLAGIGGGVEPILQKTEAGQKNPRHRRLRDELRQKLSAKSGVSPIFTLAACRHRHGQGPNTPYKRKY